MKPKLPRALLWTDKTSMEEFLRDPINERLYDFYLELKNTRWHFGPDNSALLLFNEIYYQLTKIEYENNLDFNMEKYTQEIDAITGKEHSIIFVYKIFFAFLLLRQNNSNVARLFQKYVFFRYNRTWDERTNSALGAIIKEEKKYQVELRPTPCRVDDLKIEELQWDEITNNFNSSSVKEVLNLWSYKEEKAIVLHLIESAYDRICRRPVKTENIMNYIRVSGDFFSKLYAELENNDGAAATIEEFTEKHAATNEDIKEYSLDGESNSESQTIMNTDVNKHIAQQFLDTDGNRVLHQLKISKEKDVDMLLSREYFAGSVCDDGSLSLLLIRILRELILPKISTRTKHSKFTWGHLYHTMDALGLALHFKSDKDKARVLYSVYEKNGVSLNAIHCAIKNKTLPKGIYTEWDEKNTDRAICSQIAEWLKPVINSKSAAEVETTINS